MTSAAKLLAIEARRAEIVIALAAGGLSEQDEDALRQEQMRLEFEQRKLRRSMQPDGGKEERALSLFASWYKRTECRGYERADWDSLDEAARRDLRPRLARVAELERMIIDDLWLVLQAPSEERSRRAVWLAEWERLVEECARAYRPG